MDTISIILVIINIVALVLLFKSLVLDKPRQIIDNRLQPWEIQGLVEEELNRREMNNGRR